jgi:autotransporter-associated beta strand protein
MSWFKFTGALIVCTLITVAALAPRASAQTFTWTGTDGSWSDINNWSGGLIPTSGATTTVQFNATDPATYLSTNDLVDSPFIVNQLNFNTTSTRLVTLNAFNAFQFGGTSPAINLSGSGPVVIQSAFDGTLLDGTNPFTVGGSGTGTLTLGGDTDTSILSGAATVTVNFANLGDANLPNLKFGNAAGWTGNLDIQKGYVVANRTTGDLFGGSTILSVASGSTFDINGNADSFGGLQGAGTIILSGNMQFLAAGDRSWSGAISGTGSLDQSGGGVFTLGGANSYTGNTIVGNGIIRAASANTLSSASVVQLSAGNGGILDLNNFDQTVGGLIGGQRSGAVLLGSATLTLNNTGTRLFNGGIAGTGGLIVTGTGTQIMTGMNSYTGATTVQGGTLALPGEGLQASSAVSIASGATLIASYDTDTTFAPPLSGAGAFGKAGPGKLTFVTANPGANLSGVSIAGGTLALDFSSDNGTKLGVNPALSLGSGTLAIIGNNSAATNRSFDGLTLSGGGMISVTSGNNQNASVAIGSITRSAGTTLDFGLTNTGSGVASVSTTSANSTAGIIGGYATVNGTSWAVSGTGSGPFNVTALPDASYTNNSLVAGSNADVTSSFTATGHTAATIRFNAAGSNTLTLSGTNNISTGGLLVTPNVGANTTTITGGNLTAPAGQALLVQQFNPAGNLTIASVISNTANSTKQTIDIAGGATIDGLTNTGNLYPGMLVTGTGIPVNARILSINSPTSITLTANATQGTGVELTFAGGTALSKSGPGTLTLTGANTYTGAMILNDGVVSVNTINNIGPNATDIGSNSVYFNGGTLRLTGSFNTGDRIQPWIVGPGGGTVDIPDVNTANAKRGNSLFGSGVLNKTGAGTFSVGTNVSTFNGYVNVKEGVLSLTSNQLRNSSGMTVYDGAQFFINDTANGPFFLGGNATLTLNGDGPGGSGAYRHGLAEAGSANYAFTSAIFLQTTSRATITTVGRGATGDTIVDTFSQTVTGPGNLIKDGDGTLILSNARNAYGGANGSTIVSNGILQIGGGDNRLPVNTTLQLGEAGSTNAGIFDLAGFNQTVAGLTTAGSAGMNHQIVNSSFTATPTLTVNYNGATAQTYAGQIGGNLGSAINFVKSGTGTLTLSASSPYTGTTTVNGGKLRVLSNNVSRPYVVADGASLDVVNTDPSSSFQMSSLTLGSTSASGLTLELTAATLPSNGVISVNDANGLVANGKVNVVFSSIQPLTIGQIPLIRYNGTIGGAGFGAFSTGTLTLPSRVIGSLVDNTGGSSIDLNISGVDFVKWNGNVNGDWNIDTTQNFKLASNSAATTYLENPAPGDTVVFDDTAAGTKTVNLTTTLKPSSVTVNGAADYTFTGPGKLSGPTGLTKNDSGTLTVLTNNDNTGLTTIGGGTLQVGNGGTTGAPGSGAIVNNGALIINRSDDVTIASSISGIGTFTKSGTNNLTFGSAYTLTGDTTIAGGTLTFNGGTVGGRILGAGALAKDGPGTLILAGAATPGAGTSVLAGTLQVGDGSFSGSLAGNVTLAGGSTLAFNRGDDTTFAGGISGAGGVSTTGGGKITLTGPLSYSGKTDVGGNSLEIGSATDFTVSGAISGTGILTKSGAGNLILPNNNPFKGTLEINQGNVILTDGGGGGDINAVAININAGGKFQFGLGGIAGENPDLPNATYITINGGEYEQRVGEVWGGTRLVSGIYRFGAAVGNTSSGTTGPFSGFVMESGTIINDAPTGNGTISLGGGNPTITKTTPGTVNVVGRVVFNAAAPINIDDGVLSFDATNVTTGGSTITLGNGATTGVFRMTGPGSASTNRPFDIPGGAFDVTDPNGTLTLTGALSNGGPLAKTGPGTLALTPSGGFFGTTTVQAGKLRMNPGDASGAFVVNTGATLAVAPGVNNITSSVPSLTLDDGSNLAFELTTPTNPTAPLLNVVNDSGVVLNGASHLISVSNDQPLQVGQFTLLDYTGTPITTGFSLASVPARAAAALVYNTANTSIDLNVTGVDSTLWNGDKSADWDLGTAADVGGTMNFKLASNSASTNFITGDRITFDDTASGTTTVNLTTALAPASIVVSNDTKDYTFQGVGSITGNTALTKQGVGKLTIANENSYTGLTSVSVGTLQIGAGGTSGSIAGPIFVESGANLNFNRSDAVTYSGAISGTGNVNKSGAGALTLGGISPFTGTMTVDGGSVVLDDLGAGGDLFASSIVVNNGASFVFGENGNPDFPDSTFVTVNTGGVFDLKQGENFGGVNLLGGTFRMSGTTRTGVNPTGAATGGYHLESGSIVTSFSGASTGGVLSGATSLDKVTPGTVTLDAGVTFGTAVTVNIREGVLAMPAASIPSGGTTTVTLGDGSLNTNGTLRITDAGVGSTARVFDIAFGGGTIDTAVAGGVVNLNGDVTDIGMLTKTGPGTVNINAVTTFAGPIQINGGTLGVAGSVANSPSITVNNTGTFSAAASQVVKNVTINSGGLVKIATGTQKVLTIGDNTTASPLTITGGKLDVTTNGLVVDVSDGSQDAALVSVRDKIVAGYNASGAGNNGDFNGNGITSSNASADASKAVGYALATEVLPFTNGSSDTFLGAPVDASSVVARYTLAGDATLDGAVDFNDLVKLAQNYNVAVSGTTQSWWNHGDFTYDGVTDFNDLVKLAQNYNTALPTSPIPGASAAFDADLARAFAGVPEPGSLSLLGLGAIGLLARRKRR